MLKIGYDTENMTDAVRRASCQGTFETDCYGQKIPKQAYGSISLDGYTSSTNKIMHAVLTLFDQIVNKKLLIRCMYLIANHICLETSVRQQRDDAASIQLDLFADYTAEEAKKGDDNATLKREQTIQAATLAIKKKYGKNAILKAISLEEGATAIKRNDQIGGHKA